MDTIQSLGYNVYFNDSLTELVNFIQQGKYSKVFILSDDQTSNCCLPAVTERLDGVTPYDLIEISSGEANKTIDFCIGVWKMLIDFGADRHSLLINVGGGVVTDLGGFVASTFKRGFDFVNVPTTLLSQVDASVGGKTGVDLDSIKNIIGTFTQPKAVFVHPGFLETLPERQVRSGLAEMLKHGLIDDEAYWDELKNSDLSVPNPELVFKSVVIKNKIVLDDPLEKGRRKCLNFGHTIGHAVETFSLDNDGDHLTHGEAIAIGMICEGWLSVQKAGLKQEELEEIISVLTRVYPKYHLDDSCYTVLNSLMKKDKKNEGDNINCTLISKIGACAINQICTEDELCESLKFYASLNF
ncbi:3-dehydroquinate synthase [Mucilaginibacter sp. RS28]|uniref:3-dehydroquinate synthase n=1 Tax=Mucilaginibacter straminoryzae TaxID=2932774 RepID=A0A9X1X0N1_9SPHI|nr:3-dehydroquinate synthase [Mucilaginibacter straminoryzae]MCJ8209067.1 3-dehydroquinate synthase [Mucilaginibacter straminoryzae]